LNDLKENTKYNAVFPAHNADQINKISIRWIWHILSSLIWVFSLQNELLWKLTPWL